MARLVSSSAGILLRRLGGVAIEGLECPLHQSGGRGISLKMPVAAARTLAGVFHLDDDVAALAAVTVPALDDPAFFHNAAANSRSQGKQHQTAAVPPLASPVFAVGRRVGVILKDRLLVQTLGQQIADRQLIPSRQVGRLEQHPAR